MAKGQSPGPSQSATTQNQRQDRLVQLAMPFAKDFASSGGPELYPGSLIAPFDPLQTQGQEMVLNSTGAMSDIVGAAGRGNQFLASGDVLRPESNPALQATIDASVRPIMQNLMEQVMPSIRNNAQITGNFGGSRQGVAQGLASGRASQAVGDTAAKVATAGYNAGLDAMAKGQLYAPTIAQAQGLPGQTTSAVGDVRQGMAQALLGEEGQRFNYEQTLPLLMAREIMSLAQGVPGGTAITSASNPAAPPSWMQYAGLGAQGLGAAGSAAYGLSQLLPVLAAMGGSDRRMKEDIFRIGTLSNGLPIYRFRYLFDNAIRIGFMADEVEKVHPEVVTTHNGVKLVNHQKLFELMEKSDGAE